MVALVSVVIVAVATAAAAAGVVVVVVVGDIKVTYCSAAAHSYSCSYILIFVSCI